MMSHSHGAWVSGQSQIVNRGRKRDRTFVGSAATRRFNDAASGKCQMQLQCCDLGRTSELDRAIDWLLGLHSAALASYDRAMSKRSNECTGAGSRPGAKSRCMRSTKDPWRLLRPTRPRERDPVLISEPSSRLSFVFSLFFSFSHIQTTPLRQSHRWSEGQRNVAGCPRRRSARWQ